MKSTSMSQHNIKKDLRFHITSVYPWMHRKTQKKTNYTSESVVCHEKNSQIPVVFP